MTSVVKRTVKMEKFISKVRKLIFMEIPSKIFPFCFLSFRSFTSWLDYCAFCGLCVFACFRVCVFCVFCVCCFPGFRLFYLILVTADRLKEARTYASFWAPLVQIICPHQWNTLQPPTHLETIQTLNGNTFHFWPLSRETSINQKHDRLQNVEKRQVSGDFPLTEIIIISKVKSGDSCHVAKENPKKIAF